MGEVDQLDDSVDHRVAQCDQGEDRSLCQPEAHGLDEVGRPALVDALGCGHRDDDHHDGADNVDNRRRWSGDD
jgi:hypothetical protein